MLSSCGCTTTVDAYHFEPYKTTSGSRYDRHHDHLHTMTTYIISKCHCGLNSFKIPFETAKLPIATEACHCSTCRHTSGQMFIHCVPFTGVPLTLSSSEGTEEPASLDNLTKYHSSDIATRYFCSKCTAHFFFHYHDGGKVSSYSVFTGTLENVEEIVTIGQHIFVGDTLDGGLADHYRVEAGTIVPRFSQDLGSDLVPLEWRSDRILHNAADHLPLSCHCKTISLLLKRPEGITESKPEWWLVRGTKDDPIKYLVLNDVCVDCRLSTGNQVQSWIIISHGSLIDGKTGVIVDLAVESQRPKGLLQYESSKDTFRESCGTCGATIFWWSKGPGGEKFDVSAGLLVEEASGSRGEGWLHWNEKVVHAKDAMNSRVVQALSLGIKATNAHEV